MIREEAPKDSPSPGTEKGDLSGLIVVDLTHHVAGPFCTKLLADLGAEVIKIERPGVGDAARWMGPFYKNGTGLEKSGLFLYLNSNKKSVTLNLKTATGKKLFRDLIEGANLVVESFAPRVMPSLGLDFETLSPVNPRLVMASISNFGQWGPYRDGKSSDLIAMAMSGMMFNCGHPSREPLKIGGYQAQYLAGLYGFLSALAALYAVGRGGLGQHVDVSIFECLPPCLEYATILYGYTGAIAARGPGLPSFDYPHHLYPCQDGHVAVLLGALGIQALALLLGRAELSPPFADASSRLAHREELDAILQPWLLGHTKREITRLGQELRMPVAPVLGADELLQDEQCLSREFFVSVSHPATGPLLYPGAPFKMTETPWRSGRAPLLGENNYEVYCQRLGLSRTDLVKMREAEIV
ncbi:MAG: CoA transferase [Chloroflexi bacterium]|nr:CoA transferase [Chloroflexota bacterium]